MEIKKASIENLKEIQNLNLLLFKEEHKKHSPTFNLNWTFGKEGERYFTKAIIDDKFCSLIAVVEDEIVGYLVGKIINKNSCRLVGQQAELDNMFTLKKFRSKDIGLTLTKHFIKWAKEKDVKNICVTVSFKNIRAVNFYKKIGFHDSRHTLEINI